MQPIVTAEKVTLLHRVDRAGMQAFVDRLLMHSHLSADEQHVLASLPGARVQVAAHRDIVRLGEVVNHACLVERGLVGRFGQTEGGARQFVSLHVGGEMVDLYSFVSPQATTAVGALSPATILQVPHAALSEAVDRYPAISVAFWRDCVRQAAIAAQWLVNVGRRDARSRMAHFLCEMAVRLSTLPAAVNQRYELPITQEDLADMLGLTSVHVNRTLMALRKEGLVSIARGFVEITDADALSAAAEFDPSYLFTKPPNGHGRPVG